MWPPPSSPPYEPPLTRRRKPTRSRRQLSHSSSFAVPFSWEHLPGIPKTAGPDVAAPPARPTDPLLPLPPLLRSSAGHPRKTPPLPRRPPAAAVVFVDDDPFAAAFAECAKDSPTASPAAEDVISRTSSGSGQRRRGGPTRTAAWSFSDRLGLLALHASCKSTCAIVTSSVYDPARSGSFYGRLSRRSN